MSENWAHLLDGAPRPDLKHRARAMGERELETRVIALIAERQLKLKDHPDSRRDHVSDPGFPDMVIVGLGGVLWRELKDQADTPSPGQRAWAAALAAAGQNWAIWRPYDLLAGRIAVELDALTIASDPAATGRPSAT